VQPSAIPFVEFDINFSLTPLQVCNQLQQMVGEEGGLGPPLSATEVSTKMGIPIAIATQHLLTAESRGILCRDDGPEGLRFFRNFFQSVDTFVC
jgi:hypothetical protein